MKNLCETDVRAAILTNRGNVTAAAAGLEVSPRELRNFIKTQPTLESFVAELRETMADYAEVRLRDALGEKKSWAVTFILKTMGKNRGYGKPSAPAPPKPQPEPEPQPEFQLDLAQLSERDGRRYRQLLELARNVDPDVVTLLDEAGDQVAAAIAKCAGNLGQTANEIGITRGELTDYLARRPEVQAAVDEAHEELADMAELVLFEAIDQKMPWAIRFASKTLGRSRGYSENPRDQVKPAPAPILQYDLGRLNDEQRLEFESLALAARQNAEKMLEPSKSKNMDVF